MAGLSLRGNLGGGGSIGGYTPLLPASASAPTTSAGNISQLAYGISGDGSPERTTAGYGAVGVGIVAIAALIYIWWSLPR